jgi:hypothetical protein
MQKKVMRLLVISFISSMVFCGGKEQSSISGVSQNNQNLAFSLALPCAQSSSYDTLSRAIAMVLSENDTITSNLTISACKVSGVIENVPIGNDRILELKIIDNHNQIAYHGTSKFNVQPGKATDVVIKLQKSTGSVNVIGTICDSVYDKEFKSDAHTLALYHFNEDTGKVLFDDMQKWNGTLIKGNRITGHFGKALNFNYGESARFDTIIPNNTPNGTIEFYFSPNDSFHKDSTYLIFGNDGSRCNIYYQNGYLIFMKNHNDLFRYVEAEVSLSKNSWYHVAATWGSKGLRLFVNEYLVAQKADISYYKSSPRTTQENVFKIGEKTTYCCMEAIGISRPLYFEGSIDELRISDIERY